MESKINLTLTEFSLACLFRLQPVTMEAAALLNDDGRCARDQWLLSYC